MEITVVQGDITRAAGRRGRQRRQPRDARRRRASTARSTGPAARRSSRTASRASRDGLATGDAGWTTAGELPARWVIHVVGPNHRAGQTDRSLLLSCYARALEVADELGARSVAFPLVTAGVYGWPKDDAIAAAVETLRDRATTRVAEARLVGASSRPTYDAIRAPADSRAVRQPQSRSTTWSMQAVSASTSAGSTAGYIAIRSWLRPSLR